MRSKMSECFSSASKSASTEGLLRWFFGLFVLARFTKSSAVWISDLFSCYCGKKRIDMLEIN